MSHPSTFTLEVLSLYIDFLTLLFSFYLAFRERECLNLKRLHLLGVLEEIVYM